jgi:hypothetical protein
VAASSGVSRQLKCRGERLSLFWAPKRPPIAIVTDTDRAAAIIERICRRCPELTRADLLRVSRVMAASEQGKDGPAPSRKPRPASTARKAKAISQATQQPAE